jgi:hypothetical protein
MSQIETGQDILSVKFRPQRMPMTLELVVYVWWHIIMLNTFYWLPNPLMHDRLINRASFCNCWSLTYKYDHDIGAKGLGFAHDTSSHDAQNEWQLFRNPLMCDLSPWPYCDTPSHHATHLCQVSNMKSSPNLL